MRESVPDHPNDLTTACRRCLQFAIHQDAEFKHRQTGTFQRVHKEKTAEYFGGLSTTNVCVALRTASDKFV
jgi:hypothetical protein